MGSLNIAVNILREARVQAIDRLAHVKEMKRLEPSWVHEDEILFLNKKIDETAKAIEILERNSNVIPG
jgi:hypothetical protein